MGTQIFRKTDDVSCSKLVSNWIVRDECVSNFDTLYALILVLVRGMVHRYSFVLMKADVT